MALYRLRDFSPKPSSKLLSGGAILLEVGYDQGPAVKALARKCFPTAKVSVVTDLSGLDRVVRIFTNL